MEASVTINTPLTDDREHKHIVLNNGIQAILVCDKRSGKSSAALGVRVGAAADLLPRIASLQSCTLTLFSLATCFHRFSTYN
jgi:hypothetical protein